MFSLKKVSPNLGLDIPSWFFYNLRAIDQDFYLIKHKYRVMWDSIINEYEGELEDPRFTIHEEFGALNFGFVLTDNVGSPILENAVHLWRHCWPHGWAHILKLESTESEYLKLVLRRLHIQAKFTDRYGFRAWTRRLDEEHSEENEKMMADRQYAQQCLHEENKWLINKAKENYERGNIAPTNPTRDVITSYSGQTNRSKIERPLTDEEGGLVTH